MDRFMDRMAKTDGLGATNQFPDGKLTPQDEGEIQLSMATVDDKIVLNFAKPIAWIGFTPDQAHNLGRLLIKRAKKLRPGLKKKGGR
jgi:hypothetical protein